MKYYVVKLLLMLGEYEKTAYNVVKATGEIDAQLQALQAESHNDDAGYGEDNDWWDDGFIYRVVEVNEISPYEENALKQLKGILW